MSSAQVKQEATMKPLLTHQPRGKATLDPIYVNKFKQGQLLPLGFPLSWKIRKVFLKKLSLH